MQHFTKGNMWQLGFQVDTGSVEDMQSPGCCHYSGVTGHGSGGQLDGSLFN